MVGEYHAAAAYALYARNVRGLALNNVRFSVAGTERRRAVVIVDHVEDAPVSCA